MGLVGRLIWVNDYGKKQCKSLFWRMRAAVVKKKAGKKQCQCKSLFGRMRATVAGKKQCKFQYDPWSYALNFDDGGNRSSSSNLRVIEGVGDGGASRKGGFVVVRGLSGATVWVYVYLGNRVL
ncbi:hypothetical protein RHSIM_Rhsim13G0175900 [Rhododendron simsii]|uniref:Uncharacterized protein n=1 Tax=Rhododendron simsii TaxID=118357 RepID=A0A834G0J2_RHOSS|nr:hypothetical protein RHSIM_Rhsim13G0175900 [Rhododendron simsii]